MGVFPRLEVTALDEVGLPHARGGVSIAWLEDHATARSSPRSWGCFYVRQGLRHHGQVFPTLVGVFLVSALWYAGRRGLPYARGGVSRGETLAPGQTASSPRSWGCFSGLRYVSSGRSVFPTLVGVFLKN